MLIIRQAQLAALRPALEHEFDAVLAAWVQDRYPQLASGPPPGALAERVAACGGRARQLGFTLKRDLAKFVDMDMRLGPAFETAPGQAWMAALLADTGLSPASRLFRIESRLERLAAVALDAALETENAATTRP